MSTNKTWETEEDKAEEQILALSEPEKTAIEQFKVEHPEQINTGLKLEPYTVKTWLALVTDEDNQYGIVEDTKGDILWVPGKGEIVGTWSKARYDGCVHICLMTHIQALQDRSTVIWNAYMQERKAAKTADRKTGKKSVKKTTSEPVIIEKQLDTDSQLKFNSLRARLKGIK